MLLCFQQGCIVVQSATCWNALVHWQARPCPVHKSSERFSLGNCPLVSRAGFYAGESKGLDPVKASLTVLETCAAPFQWARDPLKRSAQGTAIVMGDKYMSQPLIIGFVGILTKAFR